MFFPKNLARRLIGCAAVALALTRPAAAQNLTAFPNALGFGAIATGGRGGTVYHVTNLNDSGTGSFRDAVSQSNRIIVFDVSGYVQLLSAVSASSNLTIAGQTAPGPGFGVFGAETSFDGRNNVIVENMRFRDGSLDPNWPGTGSADSHTNAVNLGTTNNTIFDHCSFAFAAYNNIDATACINCTIQNCIFGDPIEEQQFNAHFETGPQTFIDNLFANSHGRNPLGKSNLQFVNNIVYNYQYAMTTGNSAGVFTFDIINNYFISGPSTTSPGDAYYQIDSSQSAYATGNELDSNNNGALDGSSDNSVNGATVLGSAWSPTTATLPTLTAPNAYVYVVSNAGPFPRDQVDSSILGTVTSLGTSGRLYGTQADTGLGNSGYGTIATGSEPYVETANDGMPDYWKEAVGLNITIDEHNALLPAAPSSYLPVANYTAIEEYFYFLDNPHAIAVTNTSASPTNTTLDLSTYAGGFQSNAVYAVGNATNGNISLEANGHTALFVPTLNFTGRASFTFTITDSNGSSLQTARVIVTPTTPQTVPPPAPPVTLTWVGDGTANNWDTTSLNWVNSNNTVVAYTSGSNVTFSNSGSASPAINLVGALSPTLITVNSTQNYTFNGTGTINGTAQLLMEGNGTLTINTAGGFTGGTNITAGTLTVGGNVSPLGTGTIALNGGTMNITSVGGITMNNTLTSTGNSSILQNASSNVYLAGALSGNGTLNFGLGSGKLISFSSGSMSGFAGTIEMGTSAGSLRIYGDSSSATGSASATFDVGNGTGTLYDRNGGTITLGALEGGPNTFLGGAGSNTTSTTYSIGAAGLTTTFYGKVINGSDGASATTGITVTAGTFTLAGTSNYTGPTTLSGGKLVINGVLGATTVTLTGGTLNGNGTVGNTTSGALIANSGSVISPGGGAGSPGTLTVGNGLTCNSTTLRLDLGNSTTAASDEVVLQTGTFTLAGTTTLTLNLLNGDPAAGNYTLVTGGTATSGSTTNISFAAPVTSTRQTYTLSTPTGGLTLTVAGSPASLTWTGAANGIWDLVSSSDWNNGGAATQFYNFDSVTFGDGVSNNTLTLSGNLQPTAVTFNNNSTAYTLTGSGAIIGTAQLVKNGSGNLTLNNANSFTGGAQLNNGTVTLGNTSALGNGTVTLNGANLAFPANGTLANTFAVTAPSTITAAGADTVTGPVSGSGNLTLELASGQMFTFQGDESAYTGTLIAAGAGTLRFNNSTDWSLANAALALNGTVVADNRSQTDIVFTLGALWGDSGTTLTASDQSAASGSDCTLVIGGLNQDSTFSGVLADSANQQISLTKVGTGTLTLAGNNTYSGDTEVQAGTLNLTGSIASFANFEVDGGATLNLSNGTIEVGSLNIDANATLTGNGTIVGDVVNDGSLLANAGGQIVVNGSFTNVGTLRLTGGEGLSVSGTFTNDGTLDLSTGNQTLPANFVNNGVVITADDVQVSAFSQGSGTYTLQIQSYAGHNYQLQRTTSLTSSWQNVGSAVAGNGTVLNFTDSSPPTPPVFYRIYVAP